VTTYTCNISSTPKDANGVSTTSITSELVNNHAGSTFVSSEDFDDKGVQVINSKTGDRKSVYSAADLEPSDIIRVEGIPMTVAQAKSAGYPFDASEPLPVESDTNDLPQQEDEALALDLREEGAATDAEVVAINNLASAAELHTGLDRADAIELGRDILTGQVPEGDAVWAGLQERGISRQAAVASIGQVVQIGQSAAMRELGTADYNELTKLADNSAAIKKLLIDHGIKRMSGKSKGVTWKHVLTLARQFARG
jgi:hypothetical protein